MLFLDHVSRTVRVRSRAVSRPLAVAGIVVVALAPITSTIPASAAVTAQTPTISLVSGNARFHAAGHLWLLSIFAFSGAAGIDLSTKHELDNWNFLSIPTSDLKVNVRSGSATLNVHNSLAPVAFANLRFIPTRRHRASCSSGSDIFFTGRVTGSVALAAHKGLRLASRHATFSGAVLDIDHHCVGRSGTLPCAAGFWTAGIGPSAGGTSPGLPGRQTYSVDVSKTIRLGAPRGATLTVDVFGTGPKPVFNGTRRTLSVRASRVVTGSAVLVASGPPTVTTSRCTLNRKHFKSRDASFAGSFTSSSQFQANSLIVGRIKVPRRGFAFFDIITFRRA